MPPSKPLVKWCGGKRRLLSQLLPHFPPTFGRYFEPFFGGGAVFFKLRPHRAWINDANPHLMLTYQVVRDSVVPLINQLLTMRYDRDEFAARRARFNAGLGDDVERAATFIYINKTGFNGLWRVNQRGACNVPFGKYDNPTICDASNLRACSAALRGVEISCGDFLTAEELAQPGDFIYCDSPYIPASETANFVGYTADGFGPEDHERLAKMFRRLATRGVHCALSNSDTPRARELYAGFPIHELSRSGSVSCKATKRGRVGEILVTSGTW